MGYLSRFNNTSRENTGEGKPKDTHRELLEAMTYEVIPLKNVYEQATHLEPGSTISVTCSPAKTIQDTLDLCAMLAGQGHRVIPHLAARMVENEKDTEEILRHVENQGIKTVFVIGGDADQRGPFSNAAEFLYSFLNKSPEIDTVGIGSYPDGHADISNEILLNSLTQKQEIIASAGFSGYMATQMCFDPETIRNWLTEIRRVGISLPCQLGVPGAVDRAKLLNISIRVGVGNSVRYLSKNRASVIRLLSPRGYNPNKLIAPLASSASELRITGLHCFTFNAVESTLKWQKKSVAKLN